VAGPWRQPRLEKPKMLDARELSFIAMLDDVHEQNFAASGAKLKCRGRDAMANLFDIRLAYK
jgi:hypothetical protein